MKFILGTLIFLFSLSSFAEVADKPADKSPAVASATSTPLAGASSRQEISGTVRVIRGSPQTEVFFKDRKDSLIIPRDSQHNGIFKACEESMKKGTPVQLVIDVRNRQILGLPDAAKEHAADGDKKIKEETSTAPSSEGAK